VHDVLELGMAGHGLLLDRPRKTKSAIGEVMEKWIDVRRVIERADVEIQNRLLRPRRPTYLTPSTNAAGIADRADRGREPVAQIGEQAVVGHEIPIVVGHAVGEQRL
jgi:hypothetical protein